MRGGTLSMLILPKSEDECLCHSNHNECKAKWNQVTGRVRILALLVNFNGHKNIIQYQTCSNPGSLWYGFSFNKDCIDINTLESDWAGLQAGPDQVLKQQNTVFYCLIHWCISILKNYDAINHTKDSKFCYSVPDKHLLQIIIDNDNHWPLPLDLTRCYLKKNQLPKNTQTDFSISVQVWIKPDLPSPCCHQLDPRGSNRIVGWTSN